MSKPSLPKGTRDFLPSEVMKRKYMFGILEQVFQQHGFVPIETPSLEMMQTLTGKYGEEGDRLLFKILNSGNFLEEADNIALENKDANKLASSIAKRGLRYDLTVPFARFVVMNRDKITFPFKRYQVQPVWRADRPQKGRYQEFYQCDCDVVGSKSLLYEADLISIYSEAFSLLGIDVIIKVNHRSILAGIAEAAGIPDKFIDMTICIDKLDKVGKESVKQEMIKRDITAESADKILQLIGLTSLDDMRTELNNTSSGAEGIKDLDKIFKATACYDLKQELAFDPSLARGLSYYTGFITEVVAKNTEMGSLGGGGRYDNLTGAFGMPDIPGVGISFGAERIFDVMETLKLFPAQIGNSLKVLVIALDENALSMGTIVTNQLRVNGIPSDQYPEVAKMNKSMKYANDLKVPFVIIIGEEEMTSGLLAFKNMINGEQIKLNIEKIIEKIKPS
ncbi:MAG: histidine--tRNA ligase [Saprospiraceae bacterium]